MRSRQSLMVEDDSFDQVMARLRAGDEDAAVAIFRRFTRRLIALSRTQLESMTRARVEVEDVVQSVYKSFFARYGRGEYEFDDWSGIWGLLTIIALRKCANR